MWDTSVIFKELSKVNNRPFGQNSPNLVTLPVVHSATFQTRSRDLWNFFLLRNCFFYHSKIWMLGFQIIWSVCRMCETPSLAKPTPPTTTMKIWQFEFNCSLLQRGGAPCQICQITRHTHTQAVFNFPSSSNCHRTKFLWKPPTRYAGCLHGTYHTTACRDQLSVMAGI
jgi:hypothetical protein